MGVKAVPLSVCKDGKILLDPQMDLTGALEKKNNEYGVIVTKPLLARLDLEIGDRIKIGNS